MDYPDDHYYRGFNGDGEAPEDFHEGPNFVRAHDRFFQPFMFRVQETKKKKRAYFSIRKHEREMLKSSLPIKTFAREMMHNEPSFPQQQLPWAENPLWKNVAKTFSLTEAKLSCPEPFPWLRYVDQDPQKRNEVVHSPVDGVSSFKTYGPGQNQAHLLWRKDKFTFSLQPEPVTRRRKK